jgi:hypothetical protein
MLAFQNLFSQQIEGKVIDQNDQPLANATVYFDGSTVGTLSRPDGTFSIEYKEQSNLTLVVRFLGFQTFYLPSPDPNSTYEISLTPEENQLDEVVLESSLFTRKQMLKAFKRDFLGETKAGRKAKILNEEDIVLYFDKNEKTLLASSKRPILVLNTELGYKVEFDLVDFISKFSVLSLDINDLRSNFFSGTSFFEDLEKENRKNQKKRLKAYKGSPMHFLKSLTSDQLNEQNFELFHKGFQVSPSSIFRINSFDEGYEISIPVNDLDKIKMNKAFRNDKFQKKVAILYKNDRSDVNFKTNRFYVDEYGNHTHIDKVLFSGEMSKSRLGEMLPINYQPNE